MSYKFNGCSLLGQNVQFLLSIFTTGIMSQSTIEDLFTMQMDDMFPFLL